MLSTIDLRLGKLENFIVPIHNVTQKLTKIESSILFKLKENGRLI